MGGLFFDFEPFRTTSRPSRRVGENAVASRRDGVSAASRRRDAGQMIRISDGEVPARSIAVSRLGPNSLKIEKETTHDLLSWRRRASMA